MDEKRRNQIALQLLIFKMTKDGFIIGAQTQRDLAGKAKDLGITPEDALLFARYIAREIAIRVLGESHQRFQSLLWQVEVPTDISHLEEIAYNILKFKLYQEGVPLGTKLRSETANAASILNIPLDEAVEFSVSILTEVAERAFVPKSERQKPLPMPPPGHGRATL